MKTQLFLAAQVLFAAVLMWTCFCRLAKTDAETHREIRWAFSFEFIASGMVFGAPFLPLLMPREANWPAYTTPPWVWMGLLASGAFVQVATARLWIEGVAQRAFRHVTGRPAAAFAVVLLLAGVTAAPRMAVADADASQPAQPLWADLPDPAHVPPGARLRCNTRGGCVLFSADAFRHFVESQETCAGPPADATRGPVEGSI